MTFPFLLPTQQHPTKKVVLRNTVEDLGLLAWAWAWAWAPSALVHPAQVLLRPLLRGSPALHLPHGRELDLRLGQLLLRWLLHEPSNSPLRHRRVPRPRGHRTGRRQLHRRTDHSCRSGRLQRLQPFPSLLRRGRYKARAPQEPWMKEFPPHPGFLSHHGPTGPLLPNGKAMSLEAGECQRDSQRLNLGMSCGLCHCDCL